MSDLGDVMDLDDQICGSFYDCFDSDDDDEHKEIKYPPGFAFLRVANTESQFHFSHKDLRLYGLQEQYIIWLVYDNTVLVNDNQLLLPFTLKLQKK